MTMSDEPDHPSDDDLRLVITTMDAMEPLTSLDPILQHTETCIACSDRLVLFAKTRG